MDIFDAFRYFLCIVSDSPGYDFLRHELQDLRAQASGSRRGAINADAAAADMRRVADQLDLVVSPLLTVLTPIVDLHNAHTWEGNAAEASRTRLRDLIDRTDSAHRSIGNVVADLRNAAATMEATADRLWGDYTAADRQVIGLESLLDQGVPSSMIR